MILQSLGSRAASSLSMNLEPPAQDQSTSSCRTTIMKEPQSMPMRTPILTLLKLSNPFSHRGQIDLRSTSEPDTTKDGSRTVTPEARSKIWAKRRCRRLRAEPCCLQGTREWLGMVDLQAAFMKLELSVRVGWRSADSAARSQSQQVKKAWLQSTAGDPSSEAAAGNPRVL